MSDELPPPRQYNVILFKVTATPSMLATLYMMYEISTDKKKRKRTYFRLMFGLSFIEFWDSVAFFLGPWAFPDGHGPYGVGNDATCQFQGFLLQGSIASMLYNSFLALYYLLLIRYNWPERRIAQKAEPWMHGIALSIAYGLAIACIPLGLFRPLRNLCYIGKQPRDCQETYRFGDQANCTQGDNATLYTILFSTVWQWSTVAFTAVCMAIIWWGVRTQENKMARYAFGDNAGVPVRKNSRRCMTQGILYVSVYYYCHFFSVVSLLMLQAQNYNGSDTLNTLVALTLPMEGFMNLLVYMRPRLVKYLKKRRKRLEAAKESAANELTAKESDAKHLDFLQSVATEPVATESAATKQAATEPAATEPTATNTNSTDVMEDEFAAGVESPDSKRSALSEELLLDEQELDDLDAY